MVKRDLYFKAELKRNNVYNCKPQYYYVKVLFEACKNVEWLEIKLVLKYDF